MASGVKAVDSRAVNLGSQPLLMDLPGSVKKIRSIVPSGSQKQGQDSLQTFLRKARRGLRGRVERRRRKMVTDKCLPVPSPGPEMQSRTLVPAALRLNG